MVISGAAWLARFVCGDREENLTLRLRATTAPALQD